jgi:hypothetical protein
MTLFLILTWLLTSPNLAQAQNVRRLNAGYGGIGRRADNCSASCNFCAGAVQVDWTKFPITNTVAVLELTEIYDPVASTVEEILTNTPEIDPTLSVQLDSFQDRSGTTTRTVTLDNGMQVTFPTPYILYQPSYWYDGVLLTDGSCVTAPPTTAAAPPPEAVAVPTDPSVVFGGVTDSFGWYYDLNTVTIDDTRNLLAADAALQSCEPNCPRITQFQPAFIVPVNPSPGLSNAFVTKCTRTIKDTGTIETCPPVKGAEGSPANADNGDTGTEGGGGDTGGGGGGDTGGGGGGDTSNTGGGGGGGDTSNSGGGGSGGGGGDNSNTGGGGGDTSNSGGGGGTDNSGGGDSSGGNGEDSPPDAGSNLYITTNAQGDTIVATANDPFIGGQITITEPDGETLVIQGASIVPTDQAGNDQDAVTVTDENGQLVVVVGGTTGTLSTGADGGTMLITGTVTQVSWTAGATITAAIETDASTQPAANVPNSGARSGSCSLEMFLPALLGLALYLL